MDIYSLSILLLIGIVGLQFWRLRGIAEYAIAYAQRYCEKEGLQFISLARKTTKFGLHRGKPDWAITYMLEFSSDGETLYTGKIKTHGKHIISVELPVFRVVNTAF
uniref:DUF3301 domain-containing protein n=1 Tax=Ningiella ruwaisensis TaxID=2364274 RepID=UPI0010A03058|nr:DUF3301 domain-containing protein [Ningiella ruwaisensis]